MYIYKSLDSRGFLLELLGFRLSNSLTNNSTSTLDFRGCCSFLCVLYSIIYIPLPQAATSRTVLNHSHAPDVDLVIARNVRAEAETLVRGPGRWLAGQGRDTIIRDAGR